MFALTSGTATLAIATGELSVLTSYSFTRNRLRSFASMPGMWKVALVDPRMVEASPSSAGVVAAPFAAAAGNLPFQCSEKAPQSTLARPACVACWLSTCTFKAFSAFS